MASQRKISYLLDFMVSFWVRDKTDKGKLQKPDSPRQGQSFLSLQRKKDIGIPVRLLRLRYEDLAQKVF